MKYHILYDSIYINVHSREILRDRKYMSNFQSLEDRRIGSDANDLRDDVTVLKLDSGNNCTSL